MALITKASRRTIYAYLNYVGFLYFVLVIFSLYLVNAFYTCLAVFDHQTCIVFITIGTFAFFNVMLNLLFFHIRTKNNRAQTTLCHADSAFPQKLLTEGHDGREASSKYGNSFPEFDVRDFNGHSAKFSNGACVKRHTPVVISDNDSSYASGRTKQCDLCNALVPVISHHCPICEYCVLKNDHHCFIINGCVGIGNQRYFVVFLFWSTVGACLGTYITTSYLNEFYEAFFPFGFVDYVFPICLLKWLFALREVSLLNLGLILLWSFGFSTAGSACALFVMQWICIVKGTTLLSFLRPAEYAVGDDGLNAKQRIRAVFGPYWALNFLFPLPFANKIEYYYAAPAKFM